MRMFAFDLALQLGWPNPDAMLARIPLPTFYEWMEYAKRKPFGEERADLRMGMATSALLNIQLAKGQQCTRPIDFMPFSDGHRKRKRQTPDQMRMVLKGIVQLHRQKTDQMAVKQTP